MKSMQFPSFLLLPSVIHAFMAPSNNNIRRSPITLGTRLYQQQPFYNEVDGQTYYYNSSDGNYYSETGQMYVDNQQYDQQQYNQEQYDQQQYEQQAYDQQSEQSLILGNDIQSEMSQLISEAGMDYLSLARQRAAEKRESVNNISTDNDWLNLAEEVKRQEGAKSGDDEWEASLDDEGSEGDASALGMGGFVTEGGLVIEGENGDEPTLLL